MKGIIEPRKEGNTLKIRNITLKIFGVFYGFFGK